MKLIILTCVLISGETLLQIYRRLIGRSYIAIARQDKIYRNISDALGKTKYISRYIGHTREAQVRPWISKFISQHITVNRRKNKIQSVKVVTKIWISTNFTITFHFYCLLRLFMSNFKIIYSYHFTINLNATTIAAESFVNPKKYIAGISDKAALARHSLGS